jgi:anti-sigma factor RsiW
MLADIQRMEEHFALSGDPEIKALMAHYERIRARFDDELSDPRDRAASRAAVLQLVRSVEQHKAGRL